MLKQRIGDYAWLAKGRKYWTLSIGNPFMLREWKIPLTEEEESIVKHVRKQQKVEKDRFRKAFPEVEWFEWTPPEDAA